MKKLFCDETNALAERLARCGTASHQERSSTVKKSAREELLLPGWLAARASNKIGSGVVGQPLARVPCANVHPGRGRVCQNGGVSVCGECHLVSYCGRACQREHWPVHKQACKHSDMGTGWAPAWIKEGRCPGWLSDRPEPRALSEHLWGNMPAFSLFPEAARKVGDSAGEVRLCFAASGDLRNVVETVAGLPEGYEGKVRVVLNDHNPKIACRNFLLLQVLGQLGLRGVDTAIALWFSMALTQEQRTVLSLLVWKQVEAANVAEGKADASWDFAESGRGSSMTAHFEDHVWVCLCDMMTSSLTLQKATGVRDAKLRDPRKSDFVERKLQALQPYHRVAFSKFRSSGLVLPFGALDAHHNTPNHFLLDPDIGYTLDLHADPLDGWDLREVLAAGARSKVPKNDLYASLFFLLRERLSAFVDRLQTAEVSFELFCEDARSLAERLGARGKSEPGQAADSGDRASGPREGKEGTGHSDAPSQKKKMKKKRSKEAAGSRAMEARPNPRLLHRVDVSNICDGNYVGVTRVLEDWVLSSNRGACLLGFS